MLIEGTESNTLLKAESTQETAIGTNVWVAVRPEKISITRNPNEADGQTSLKGVVWDIGYYGNLSIYRVKTEDGTIVQVSSQNFKRLAEREIDWDDEVYVSWDTSSSIVLTE